MSDENTIAISAESFKKQDRQIWVIGGSLMFFAAVTVFLGSLAISTTAHIVLALIVAAIQVCLQVFIFMHLKTERGVIFKFLVFTAFFAFALFFLTHLAHSNPLISKAFPGN